MLLILLSVALGLARPVTGAPPPVTIGPGPTSPPGATLHYRLYVRGRLKEGAFLQVLGGASYDVPNAPGLTGIGPSALCYQHGTSRRLCASTDSAQWTVRVLPGRDQFLTLWVAGKTVARVVFRNVRIAGPPGLAEAPIPVAMVAPVAAKPTPRYGFGLTGPVVLRVGQHAYFAGPLESATLCYKHGTSRMRCQRSPFGGFYVTIRRGHDQYFTLRHRGKVVGRLVYHRVT